MQNYILIGLIFIALVGVYYKTYCCKPNEVAPPADSNVTKPTAPLVNLTADAYTSGHDNTLASHSDRTGLEVHDGWAPVDVTKHPEQQFSSKEGVPVAADGVMAHGDHAQMIASQGHGVHAGTTRHGVYTQLSRSTVGHPDAPIPHKASKVPIHFKKP